MTHDPAIEANGLMKDSIKAEMASNSQLAPLDADKLTYSINPNPLPVPSLSDPATKHGTLTTSHMITCEWSSTDGWGTPHLIPYGDLALPPTASVLHYATECFEGMKVYRGTDSKLRLFRPSLNTTRMLSSAARISLPTFDPSALESLIKSFVAVDAPRHLPSDRRGEFLYLRPTLIGTMASLDVQIPTKALLFVIATYFAPVSDDMPSGLKLLASSDDTIRAWPGGFGYAKIGANYGPALAAQKAAKAKGFSQILWLFGKEGRVTEAGASNFFVVWKNEKGETEMVTAPLGERIILDGVTRRSILQIVGERMADKGWDEEGKLDGVKIVERDFTMDEIVKAADEGRLVEAFAVGTAYFVTGVEEIEYKGRSVKIPTAEGTIGSYAARLKGWMKKIIYGPDEHKWGVVVQEKDLVK